MPHRSISPARSENEFDISTALFADADSSGPESPSLQRQQILNKGNKSEDLNGHASSAEDDDEDFIAATQAAANRKGSTVAGKSVKGGGFKQFGLSANLLKAISRKGYAQPTPIQRRVIPLILSGNLDVVGMARTGSGKTLAYVAPMLEIVKQHSAQMGARGLVMLPSRELALQVFKVVKELGKGMDLRVVLLVGGDSVEEQFGMISTNPDIVIGMQCPKFLNL